MNKENERNKKCRLNLGKTESVCVRERIGESMYGYV